MSSMKGEDTRNIIKVAARRLFALRGIDGVSVRDIAAAAEQRNSGSINYYFRSKEALVSELVVDGAKAINERRNAMLDGLEAARGSLTLRKVVDVLVRSTFGPEDGLEDHTYLRFIAWLQMNHRDLFLAALDNTWNTGYQRCLAHIRALLPSLPAAVLNQRLVFMGLYLNATLSAREAALDAAGVGGHGFWDAAYTMDNLTDTVLALLEGKPSAATTKQL
ncbi:TetR/AcrR family transcriptional regulator [Noviherbaspirillum pedocola]|uniref:TetR/AcrR family transcriptional regulator n=1 Tax=Noviherbaspirillum pedocola TaxID=2801341 RepID=A0A934T398_9BURK|nr:TetR/AcrR family transcriptional regulator [Noviherbaspirillum pedocola]MBK4738704.1 TetR/AcrR family transcriptional regulator [Noviherbaspirillum pedocola]